MGQERAREKGEKKIMTKKHVVCAATKCRQIKPNQLSSVEHNVLLCSCCHQFQLEIVLSFCLGNYVIWLSQLDCGAQNCQKSRHNKMCSTFFGTRQELILKWNKKPGKKPRLQGILWIEHERGRAHCSHSTESHIETRDIAIRFAHWQLFYLMFELFHFNRQWMLNPASFCAPFERGWLQFPLSPLCIVFALSAKTHVSRYKLLKFHAN